MFKKLLFAAVLAIASVGFAFSQVDVNRADQAALDGVKGVGPVLSKTIIEARKKGGDFKDWADFEKRVKGIGEQNSIKLSQAGLVVNGQAKANAPATVKGAGKAGNAGSAAAKSDAKVAVKSNAKVGNAKPEAKADAKADADAAKKADTAKAPAAGTGSGVKK